MAAIETAGKQRSTLMKQIPVEKFYTCRGYYLHHKLGDFTEDKARKQRLGTIDKDIWSSLIGTVRQDSFATLLRLFRSLKYFHSVELYSYSGRVPVRCYSPTGQQQWTLWTLPTLL